LAGKLLFCAVCVSLFIVIGLVAPIQPWIWLSPMALPFVALLLDHQYQQLKEIVALHLGAAAQELKLIRFARPVSDASPSAPTNMAVAKPVSTANA